MYVVVFIGEAATGFEVVELKPPAGVQRKVPVVTGVNAPPTKTTFPLKFLGLKVGAAGAALSLELGNVVKRGHVEEMRARALISMLSLVD